MKLNKDLATEWWMDDLAGQLDAERKLQLETYLSENPDLASELRETQTIWTQMETMETPEPGESMDVRFQAMLSGYQSAASKQSFDWTFLTQWFRSNWQVGFAALVIGLVIGTLVIPRPNQEVNQLASEVQEMKKMLMLTLIEKPQAQERIKAVNMVSDMPRSDEKVIDALVFTLNQDPSNNVRLAALEALMVYGNNSNVREALVSSISTQESPLLQVALADAMILLQEKSAAAQFSKVLSSPKVDDSIKSKLESTIQTLKEI
ncbi:HEAT repeat domain-containing protein [Marinoscillum sp.]|uniref:HEAT repeat domain-containing protein n=1 Tax=Marinoscillum sp. TaxID=2024838 RepID=UPI003BA91BF1